MEMAILDLEWNSAYSRRLKGYINEIIEFGAVKIGEDLAPKSQFSCFVKPQVGKQLNSVVMGLTSITQDNLVDGVAFMQAVSRFRRWLGDCLLLTWGPADVHSLIENCRYFSGDIRIPFLTRYCDLQSYTQKRLDLGASEQVGLERAAELLGLDISQHLLHRALDDSLLALEVLKKVYDREAISPCIMNCDEEFYRRMTFRTSFVRDLDDPRLKPEHLSFSCPKCGGECRRKSEWIMRNRSFKANFRCKACGTEFSGRTIIKQKYEGLVVNKKIVPLPVIEQPRNPGTGDLGNMVLQSQDGVGLLRFRSWTDLAGINHIFSTRVGGVSQGEFAAMNLGFSRGDSNENVSENYIRLCRAAGFDSEGLVCGCQVHGTNIRRVTDTERGRGIWRENDIDSADGLCTNTPGVTLVVYAADCVPVYFYDSDHRAIGLAHAGWRGAAAGMPQIMAERMEQEFGTKPEGLLCAIGPSICKDCFEVDEPVAKEFLRLPDSGEFVFGPQDSGFGEKYYVDLWECCRRSLMRAGVPEENIVIGGVCTMENSDLVFSHRKTRGQRGSNCAMLSLSPEA